ncbi:protein NYNRIN-like [Anolis carolinensis]|uniref:protein NYNRIN-like n=1 Tax=Anolis carolinensis TaxID=28377 RepID=UPI002F2B55C0
MEYKGHHWFTNSRMLKYQTLLCENPRIKLQVCSTLNPASLLPVEGELLQHDCLETMDEVYSSRPDLKDQPWPKADATLFTDGSSFIENGQRYSGYAVVTATTVWEAEPLPLNTSAQKAELIALIRALELSEGKTVNIYTDSKYAFTILHAHGALYKEKGLLNSAGKQIQHCETILRLLDAVWIPAKVAVMHCRGHQYGEDPVTSGNRYADTTAKAAARKGRGQEPVMAPLQVKDWLQKGDLPYTPEEKQWAQREEAVWKDGWLVLPDQRLFVPRQVAWELIKEAHQETHMGKTALASLLGRQLYINGLTALTGIASAQCHICAKNNPRTGPLLPPGNQYQGNTPFESLVVDFTEMPRYGPHKYLLVFVCTHSGWPEAYPTRTEKAAEVSKALLRDIIPRYGIPLHICSDIGPAFVSEILQTLVQMLGTKWKLHCAYRPQSSGKVERMNQTLKGKLSKMCQETHLPWTRVLPMALLQIRCTPTRFLGLSPFELMYGRPPLGLRHLQGDITQLGQQALKKDIQTLGQAINQLQQYTEDLRPPWPATPLHSFHPGDSVLIKDWKIEPLGPKWKGPFTVLLSTPTAVKVEEIKAWIHYTRVKKAPPEWTATPDPDDPLKLRITKQEAL